jgi:predicted transcriptional regulator
LAKRSSEGASRSRWHFLSNHTHVLLSLSAGPDRTLREVADSVGVTERAVQRIVGELEDAGVLTRTREGRRNHYEIHRDVPLRHPLESHHSVGELLEFLADPSLRGEHDG